MNGELCRVTRWVIACVGILVAAMAVAPAVAGTNSWTAIGPPDTNNTWGSPFAVDPSSPSTVYAVRNGTIMKTSDGGSHWDLLVNSPAYVKQIVIDPATPATVYAVGGITAQDLGITIYKSVDAGVNWVRYGFGSPLWLAIAPTRSSTLYAAAFSRGVLKSTDGGLSWASINNGLPDPYVDAWGGSLAVDPTNADTAYVVTYPDGRARISKLSPGADQWRQLPIRFPVDAIVNALAIDPVTPSIVYASYNVTSGNDILIEAGTFKTVDGGDTWAAVPNPRALDVAMTFAIDPRAPWRIYAAMNYGVYMSTDAGASWTAINAGLPNLFVWGLYIDATGSTLRTASYGGLFEYHPDAAMPAPVQTAIEYGFRSVWDYGYSSYFVTASPPEIAALDHGDFNTASGLIWERTGESFGVWAYPANGALPTCRFFYFNALDNGAVSLDHFYTPYAAECAQVQAGADTRWQYEGMAFYLQVPDANGHCPAGTAVLYRLYNNGSFGAPVHRLTTNLKDYDEFRIFGGVLEGDARTGAFACVPSPTTSSAQ